MAAPPFPFSPDNAAGLHFLYGDDDLLVIDKPAGLLSVPGRGDDKQDCVSARAQQMFPDALVVHRLDMATSGLMLMARHPLAQRRLSLAFEERRVHKRYVAVVDGRPVATPEDHGGWALIDLPIAVDWPRRPLRVIDHDAGKPSQTRWRISANPSVQDSDQDSARLDLEPVTGRSHQLRVHLLALGHPILGDALYAPTDVLARAPRLLLHATRLQLMHPTTGEPLRFDSPAPF